MDKNTNRCTFVEQIPNTIQKDRIVTGKMFRTSFPAYCRYGEYDENEIVIHDNFYTNNKICHFSDPDYPDHPTNFYKGFYGTVEVILDRDDIDIQFPKTFHYSFVKEYLYLYDHLLDIYYELQFDLHSWGSKRCKFHETKPDGYTKYSIVYGKIHQKDRPRISTTGDENEKEVREHDLFYENNHIAIYPEGLCERFCYKGKYETLLVPVEIVLEKDINIDFPKIMKVPNGKKVYISDNRERLLYELENVPWTLL